MPNRIEKTKKNGWRKQLDIDKLKTSEIQMKFYIELRKNEKKCTTLKT